MRILATTAVVAALLLANDAVAQDSIPERPVRWSLAVHDTVLAAGDTTTLGLAADVDDGWYLYALSQPEGGPQPLEITVPEGSSLRLVGPIGEPKPRTYPDVTFNLFTAIHRGDVAFELPVAADPGPRDPHGATVLVRFQTCNSRYCLPPTTDTVQAAVRLIGQDTVQASAAPVPASVPPSPGQVVTGKAASGSAESGSAEEERSADRERRGPLEVAGDATGPSVPAVFGQRELAGAPSSGASAVAFLALAFAMGLLSLLTPCVFPMVPLTVSYFSGNGSAPRARQLRDAAFFGAGMALTFVAVGAVVALALGAGAVPRFAADPWLNIALAALFVLFALNLLGVFELRLPTSLMTRVSGLGGAGSAAGATLMGVAFAVTSFTCTVPFAGTLLVLATQGSWRWPMVGLAVYGVAFALPFLLLAAHPGALARLPRSGAWMHDLRRILAVLEIALAIKFLTNADLVWNAGLLTRDVVIVAWMLAGLAATVLVLWRRRPAPARIAAAGLAVATVVWLAGGLRGQRLGELESFLPPPPPGVLLAGPGELPWLLDDYEGALRTALDERRPLLVDFTGYTCTNCRWMEANMFTRQSVNRLLSDYVRVRLFTDGLATVHERQQALQARMFGTVALPYYAILTPEGRPVATFLGMTRDEREFVGFLQAGLALETARR